MRATDAPAPTQDMVTHLFDASTGYLDVVAVYLGQALGYYGALAGERYISVEELCSRVGADQRYTLEWCRHQLAMGALEEDIGEGPLVDELSVERRFRLHPAVWDVFAGSGPLSAGVSRARMLVGMTAVLPQLVDAFRSGAGVPYESYPPDAKGGIAAVNRHAFDLVVDGTWLPKIVGERRHLLDSPARILDVGCGAGWSTIALGRAFARATVDGFDSDEWSIAQANARDLSDVEPADIPDRLRFECARIDEVQGERRYDVGFMFETLHCMTDPVASLRAIHRLLEPGGALVVAEGRLEDGPHPSGAPLLERFLLGVSIVHCLPVGRAGGNPNAPGTAVRRATLESYARQAGFESCQVLEIDDDVWHFYEFTKAGPGCPGGC